MKILSLNTWGGKLKEPLLAFLRASSGIDIFCLQEVYRNAPLENMGEYYEGGARNLFDDIQAALPDHVGYFRPVVGDYYELAIFIRKEIVVESEGDILIHETSSLTGNHSRNLQYVRLRQNGVRYTVANVHGLWDGSASGRGDTDDRIKQSEKIVAFLTSAKGEKVLCGDLNLEPGTQSLALLEKEMRNLIREYGVPSTRPDFYTKPGRFADYAFVSAGISVKDFRVLPAVVSDHLPLLLDI